MTEYKILNYNQETLILLTHLCHASDFDLNLSISSCFTETFQHLLSSVGSDVLGAGCAGFSKKQSCNFLHWVCCSFFRFHNRKELKHFILSLLSKPKQQVTVSIGKISLPGMTDTRICWGFHISGCTVCLEGLEMQDWPGIQFSTF